MKFTLEILKELLEPKYSVKLNGRSKKFPPYIGIYSSSTSDLWVSLFTSELEWERIKDAIDEFKNIYTDSHLMIINDILAILTAYVRKSKIELAFRK